MTRIPPALTPDDGDGEVGMQVESDFVDPTDPSGRLTARRRVQKAGCSLRRSRTAGGGRPGEIFGEYPGRALQSDDEFELIAYKETDDNGRVTFENLPAGLYRVNIQYPGVPMDPNTFTEFEVGEDGAENNTLSLEATVTEGGIAVELAAELAFYRKYFKDLEVFPNPADKFLTIKYAKLVSDQVEVQLLDLRGQVILEEKVSKGYDQRMLLNVEDVEEGMYLLRFYDPKEVNGGIVSYRVLIRR